MSALECPVCLENYDDKEHEPKILPCSGAHELCSKCLQQLQKKLELTCPECREPIKDGARINTNRGLLAALSVRAQIAVTATAAAAVPTLIGDAASSALCSKCEQRLPRDAFSKAQLAKGAATRRCKACLTADAEHVGSKDLVAPPPNADAENTGQATSRLPPPPKVFNVSLWCAEAAATCPEVVRLEMGRDTPLRVLRMVEAGGKGRFNEMRQAPECQYPELASRCLTCGATPPPRRDVAHVLEMRHRPLLLCVAPGGGMEGARAQGHVRLVPAVRAGGGVPLRAFYPVSRARDGAVWSRERPGPSL